MADFEVIDQLSLGEAVWRSGPGDTIRFISGHYGRVVVKGCNVLFPEDRSVTIGQLVGGGVVRNATFRKNKGSLFVFRKLLPFNLRIKPDEPYYHPTGTAVTFKGHDKEMGSIDADRPAQGQLPNAIVDVEVPRTDEINFAALKRFSATPAQMGAGLEAGSKDEIFAYVEADQKLRELLKAHPLGPPVGEVEYEALWALNHFLRQYASVAKTMKITGLSMTEFRDGRILAYGPWAREELISRREVYIDEYHSVPLKTEEQQKLQNLCLSSKDYSVSEYIVFGLDRLNYPMATVGMAQLLEANGLAGNWWSTLEASTLSAEKKRYVAEIMICRHVILHQHECAVKNNVKGFGHVRKRFGLEPLSEYVVYSTRRPWRWYLEGLLPYLGTREALGLPCVGQLA